MDKETVGIIALIAITIIAYIVAQIFSRKTECVILYKWYDFACLLWIAVSPLFIGLGNKIFTDGEMTSKTALVNRIIFMIPIAILVLTSIFSNLGHGWMSLLYIFVSIMAKIPFIIGSWIIAFALFLTLYAGASAKTDARYHDGTRRNEKTNRRMRAIAIFFAIFNPLLFDLVKPRTNRGKLSDFVYNRATRDL
ncbi:MAG: hypothetical protein IKP46_07760 [Bacteroidales bacterium]|nr:hypothetical protein [Bacteroidales bacterium]